MIQTCHVLRGRIRVDIYKEGVLYNRFSFSNEGKSKIGSGFIGRGVGLKGTWIVCPIICFRGTWYYDNVLLPPLKMLI